jgi:hypothetical protein
VLQCLSDNLAAKCRPNPGRAPMRARARVHRRQIHAPAVKWVRIFDGSSAELPTGSVFLGRHRDGHELVSRVAKRAASQPQRKLHEYRECVPVLKHQLNVAHAVLATPSREQCDPIIVVRRAEKRQCQSVVAKRHGQEKRRFNEARPQREFKSQARQCKREHASEVVGRSTGRRHTARVDGGRCVALRPKGAQPAGAASPVRKLTLAAEGSKAGGVGGILIVGAR